ncbi:endo alpha-1,4 polygalactosaminidase [Phaeacidiphilus oryzae]|uniref:endo alpha-1,4 polygalactosaminidase n=1 Tax=Phaeacidiphilus oryzae TaxID=348818 RepID=UPI0005687BEC|nr:endo alpha-1,4 polygalactosaminidase [Phaeacidiphilus oryzae]
MSRTGRRALLGGAAVLAVLCAVAAALLLPGRGGGGPERGAAAGRGAASGRAAVRLPAAHAGFDYQIGGAYPPAAGVRVVSRDRSDPPPAGRYGICYVNAFQAQPDELGWWRRHHPELLLRGADGTPVIDRDWNEALLDVSSRARRTRLAAVVGAWIDGCARDGYQAVEPDNLDSYQRSQGRLSASDNAAFARLLAARAHADGLAIGQKNTAELLGRRAGIGFDFAVTEECGRYGECAAYASAYADRVFDVEYDPAGLAAACRSAAGRAISIVLRDRDVAPAGEPGHVYRTC